MPKKTKKQKQQTVERRKTDIMKQPFVHEQIVTPEQPIAQHTLSYSFTQTQQASKTKEQSVSQEDKELYLYVKEDIFSTILFAAISIGSLFALSFFLN